MLNKRYSYDTEEMFITDNGEEMYVTEAVDRLNELEAENQRLREAINKALDLDSRSHTREGWKRDIVRAIEILKEALENAT